MSYLAADCFDHPNEVSASVIVGVIQDVSDLANVAQRRLHRLDGIYVDISPKRKGSRKQVLTMKGAFALHCVLT